MSSYFFLNKHARHKDNVFQIYIARPLFNITGKKKSHSKFLRNNIEDEKF